MWLLWWMSYQPLESETPCGQKAERTFKITAVISCGKLSHDAKMFGLITSGFGSHIVISQRVRDVRKVIRHHGKQTTITVFNGCVEEHQQTHQMLAIPRR